MPARRDFTGFASLSSLAENRQCTYDPVFVNMFLFINFWAQLCLLALSSSTLESVHQVIIAPHSSLIH